MSNDSTISRNIDEWLNNAWFELGDVRKLKVNNKLLVPEWDNPDNVPDLLVELCRQPQYLHFLIKYILKIDLLPFQVAVENIFWTHSLPMIIGSRGSSKSFMLAVYCVCRALLHQGCKIVVVGASLRQSLVIYNYIEAIWDNSPILRDICGGKVNRPKSSIHTAYWQCGNSIITFLPLGTGEKIRGQRANVIIVDEFSSVSPAIFETVIRGFAAVKSDNLHGNVVEAYKRKIIESMGISFDSDELLATNIKGVPTILNDNQIIISGSADYQFNHFYKYFKQYETIIECGGKAKKIRAALPELNITEDFDPSPYAVIRIPYEYLPPGMMDTTILQQGAVTMDKGVFQMEYGACFPADSEGFFVASALAAATCPIQTRNTVIDHGPKVFGDSEKRYVMGIDPASEQDNFAISIIELHGEYGVLVYQFTTNRKKFEKLKDAKLVDEGIEDYHTFCVKHVRNLLRRFNVELIVLDAAGGGFALKEGFRDPAKFGPGESAILDIDEQAGGPGEGKRILKLIHFTDTNWRVDAHHGMRKDILEKCLVFPAYDAASMEADSLSNVSSGLAYDTLEECYLEILEAKTETTLIKYNKTPNGIEQWDVPRVKGMNADLLLKRLKRDRFTSLLLANWGRRRFRDLNPEAPTSDGLRSVKRGKFTSSVAGMSVRCTTTDSGRKIFY